MPIVEIEMRTTMFNRITKTLLISFAVTAISFGTTACSSTTNSNSDTSFVATEGQSISSTIQLSEANGQTFNVMAGDNISVAGGIITNDKIDASISDGNIAQFMKGKVSSNSTTAPVIKALKAGSTEITFKLESEDKQISEVKITLVVLDPAPISTVKPTSTATPTN